MSHSISAYWNLTPTAQTAVQNLLTSPIITPAIERAHQALALYPQDRPHWDELVWRRASMRFGLSASAKRHHSWLGGVLRHELETAAWAAQLIVPLINGPHSTGRPSSCPLRRRDSPHYPRSRQASEPSKVASPPRIMGEELHLRREYTRQIRISRFALIRDAVNALQFSLEICRRWMDQPWTSENRDCVRKTLNLMGLRHTESVPVEPRASSGFPFSSFVLMQKFRLSNRRR